MSKLILVTGVGRGLGRVMTETFIQSGHTVIGCSLNKEAIATLEQKFGEPIILWQPILVMKYKSKIGVQQ